VKPFLQKQATAATKLVELNGGMDKFTIIVGDFNTPLS
jgi:hypothetical protein